MFKKNREYFNNGRDVSSIVKPIDLSNCSSVTINELRTSFAVQQELENETSAYAQRKKSESVQEEHGSSQDEFS